MFMLKGAVIALLTLSAHASDSVELVQTLAREVGDAAEQQFLQGGIPQESVDQVIEAAVQRVRGEVEGGPQSDEDCDWQCYMDRYPGLKNAFGDDLAKAENHYTTNGRSEGRDCTCPTTTTTTPANTISIENNKIGIEIDLNHGCAISGAWSATDPEKTNLVNTHDLGRYIQVSYYSGPVGYANCSWGGRDWPWNPIGAGDVKRNAAQILTQDKPDSTTFICSLRPIQWACDNVLCDCTVDIEYRLDGNAMIANVTLNMDREDKTAHPARNQELPAVYTNGPFYRLVGYTGDQPCTGDEEIEEWDGGFNNSAEGLRWVPGHVRNTLTEPVMSLVDVHGFGLGVYSRFANEGGTHFLAGFAGGESAPFKGAGGPKDNPTGYLAPIATKALAWNEKYNYDYALIIGDLTDIRDRACNFAERDGLV